MACSYDFQLGEDSLSALTISGDQSDDCASAGKWLHCRNHCLAKSQSLVGANFIVCLSFQSVLVIRTVQLAMTSQ